MMIILVKGTCQLVGSDRALRRNNIGKSLTFNKNFLDYVGKFIFMSGEGVTNTILLLMGTSLGKFF